MIINCCAIILYIITYSFHLNMKRTSNNVFTTTKPFIHILALYSFPYPQLRYQTNWRAIHRLSNQNNSRLTIKPSQLITLWTSTFWFCKVSWQPARIQITIIEVLLWWLIPKIKDNQRFDSMIVANCYFENHFCAIYEWST